MKDRLRAFWLAGCMLALLLGAYHGWLMTELASAEEENLFALPASGDGFSIEVIGVQTPAPPKRVLIYHTHTYEALQRGRRITKRPRNGARRIQPTMWCAWGRSWPRFCVRLAWRLCTTQPLLSRLIWAEHMRAL